MKKIKSFFGYFLFSSCILLLANAIFLFQNHNLPDGRILFMLPVTSAFVLSYMVCIGLMSSKFLDSEKSCWMAGYVTVLSIFFLFFAHPIYVIFQFVHFLPEVLLKMPYVGVFPFSDYFLIFGIGTIIYSLILMKLNGWMERRLPIALCGLGAFLVSSVILVGGAYFYSFSKKEYTSFIFPECTSSAQVSAPAETEIGATKLYTNDKRNFSIRYPADLNEVKEGERSVIFSTKGDSGMFGYAVIFEKTAATSTKEWLQIQPKGGADKEGYELVSWLYSSGAEIAVVSEYVLYDRDDTRDIYRKGLYAIYVGKGTVYKIPFGPGGQFSAEQVPWMGDDILNFILTFRPYVEK